MSVTSLISTVQMRVVDNCREEYNVRDLYSKIDTKYSLTEIMNKMILEDFIGKHLDYISRSCVNDFLKIASE